MRTDYDSHTIDPEHEALCSYYYDRAIAGDDLDCPDDLTSWVGTASYARDLPDGRTLLVDIGIDGSHITGIIA